MFFGGRKIGYLSVYRNGEKTEPAGFVKMHLEGNRMHISVQVKMSEKLSGKYPFFLCANKKRIFVTDIVLVDGKGMAECIISGSRTELSVDQKVIVCNEITGFIMQPKEEMTVEVRWQTEKTKQEEKECESKVKEESVQKEVNPAPIKTMK